MKIRSHNKDITFKEYQIKHTYYELNNVLTVSWFIEILFYAIHLIFHARKKIIMNFLEGEIKCT